jgi:hypothetical protein
VTDTLPLVVIAPLNRLPPTVVLSFRFTVLAATLLLKVSPFRVTVSNNERPAPEIVPPEPTNAPVPPRPKLMPSVALLSKVVVAPTLSVVFAEVAAGPGRLSWPVLMLITG